MIRVVSVTPAAVERESRTMKVAASLHRFNYDSLVVEGIASRKELLAMLPFAVISPFEGGDDVSSRSRAMGEGPIALPSRLRAIGWFEVCQRVRAILSRILTVPMTIINQLNQARADADRLPSADLYWLHGYTQFPAVWLAARRQKVPFVYDAHDFYAEIIDGGASTRLENWIMRHWHLASDLLCARAASAIVTVSDGVADLMEHRYRRRPQVIRNCSDSRIAVSSERDVRMVTGIGPADFLTVMAGNNKPGIAVVEAVNALSGLPSDIHLAFVGAGYTRYADLVARLGLSARVHLLPAVPAVELASFIATADLGAVLYKPESSNLRNALPNGLFTAINAGLPLVYSELFEIELLTHEHQLGIGVNSADPKSIAGAIRLLYENKDLRATHAANSQKAREQLSWEREEVSINKIVETLVA